MTSVVDFYRLFHVVIKSLSVANFGLQSLGKNLQPVSSALSDFTTEVTLTYVDQTMHSTYTIYIHSTYANNEIERGRIN